MFIFAPSNVAHTIMVKSKRATPVGTSRHTKGHVDSLDEVTHNMHEVTHRLTIERVVLH